MAEGDRPPSDFATDEHTTPDEERPWERRREPRVAAAFRIRYKTVDDFVVAYSADISRGGLFLATKKFLPIGSVIRLELQLPKDGPVVKIIARVAYILDEATAVERDKKPGMGMEFLDVDGGPIDKLLASFLAEHLGGQADAGVPTTPARIIVVDDDDTYRERAAAVLRGEGHEVTVASNGLEGLGAVLREPPDLILTDLQMPTMDGWQLLRMVRARPSVAHVPIVFFTTLSGEDERLKGYQLGVDDYIAKPFNERELAVRITRILRQNELRPRSAASKNALRGDLSQVGLASVLSFIEMEKRSGTLLLVSGDKLATLHIASGNVVRVDLPADGDALAGMERLFYVLDWTEGRFDLTAGDVHGDDQVGVPTSFALLEHARRTDEGSR
jgi:uncharacterized protein (TIGR02266 family)